MTSLIIEPHYFGSIEYYSLISNYDKLILEVNDKFRKQTFRNRTYFLLSNKVQILSVPLVYRTGDITKDVKIDYSQRWVKDHWGAFYSAYGKAPFFDYFKDYFQLIWEEEHKFLVDLIQKTIRISIKLLQLSIEVELSSKKPNEQISDFRDAISPKESFSQRKIYNPQPYNQLFGNTFVPNLSIVDLILNEGSAAKSYLVNS